MIYKPKRTWQRLQKSTRNKTKYTDDCQKVLSIVTCIVKSLLEEYQLKRIGEKRISVYTKDKHVSKRRRPINSRH